MVCMYVNGVCVAKGYILRGFIERVYILRVCVVWQMSYLHCTWWEVALASPATSSPLHP